MVEYVTVACVNYVSLEYLEVARYVYTLILKNLNTLSKNYFKFDVCRYENNIFKHRITLVIVLHLFIRLNGMVKDIIGNIVL